MILNLTQHPASKEQKENDVVNVKEKDREFLKELLTFKKLPTMEEIKYRAIALKSLAQEYNAEAVMLGGAPYLMYPLHKIMEKNNILPLYAFSLRKSKEKEKDGKVIKINIFQHIGFVGK